MNPVDHVSRSFSGNSLVQALSQSLYSLMVVVIINILVKPLQSQDTQHKDKRPVLLQLGELVFLGVHRKRRIRYSEDGYRILISGSLRNDKDFALNRDSAFRCEIIGNQPYISLMRTVKKTCRRRSISKCSPMKSLKHES